MAIRNSKGEKVSAKVRAQEMLLTATKDVIFAFDTALPGDMTEREKIKVFEQLEKIQTRVAKACGKRKEG